MRNTDYWRLQWSELPPELTAVDAANDKKEKRGFAAVITWPLTLLILQAGIYAPLFGSGFLSSPHENEPGIDIVPTIQDPNLLLQPEITNEKPIEDPKNSPTAKPSTTPTTAPTTEPTKNPSVPIANPTPSQTGEENITPTPTMNPQPNPSVAEPTSPVEPTPIPTPIPIPEEVKIDLVPEEESSIITKPITAFPGDSETALMKVTNKGNVPLGDVFIRADSSNAVFKDSSQGLNVHAWACNKPWAGTIAKPICSGTLVNGGYFKMSDNGKQIPGTSIRPGESQYFIFGLELPSSADNRFQGQKTTVKITASAQQTGGVAQ